MCHFQHNQLVILVFIIHLHLVIRVGDTYTKQQSQLMDFHFVGNSIRAIDDPIQILIADDFNLHLSQLKFLDPIDCEAAARFANNNFLMRFADTVYFRIGASGSTESTNFTLTGIGTRECKGVSTSTLVAIISGTTILLVVLVVLLGFVAFRYIERRQGRQLTVVMPEGKTYRETQIVMQIEHAGLMKTDL